MTDSRRHLFLIALLSLVLSQAWTSTAAAARIDWVVNPQDDWDLYVWHLPASELRVRDRDSRTLTGATIRIVGGAEHGERLAFVKQLGITGTYNSGTGVLTLRGRASPADYQTALRSVWYRHDGAGASRKRRIAIRVRDGGGQWSPRAARGMEIAVQDDAAFIASFRTKVEYQAGGGPQPIAPHLAVLDLDSRIPGASVEISSNFSSSEDQLMFENQRGIQGTYNSGTGVLTLTGTASSADYQAALRSVAYSTTAADPGDPGRTFSLWPSDHAGVRLTLVLDNDYAEPANTVPFPEGSPPSLLVSHWTPIDTGDVPSIRAVQVRIRNVQAGERLFFVRQLGITGTYNSGTGVLTLTGPPAGLPWFIPEGSNTWVRVLRSVWYQHTGDRPSRSRAIELRLRRANGSSTRWMRDTLNITRVNDAPSLGPESGRSDYRIGDGPQPIAPGIALLDPDSRISRATVQISSNFSETEDQLVFENRRGITGTYDSGTGILTLTGAASGAAYQAALRSVEYVNNSTAPSSPGRRITFSVTDVFGFQTTGNPHSDLDF